MAAIKTKKRKNRLSLQNHFSFTLSTLSNMLPFYENDSILDATFSAVTKTTDTFNKNKRCQITLEGLSSFCAKLEPASSKKPRNTRDQCSAKVYFPCSLSLELNRFGSYPNNILKNSLEKQSSLFLWFSAHIHIPSTLPPPPRNY